MARTVLSIAVTGAWDRCLRARIHRSPSRVRFWANRTSSRHRRMTEFDPQRTLGGLKQENPQPDLSKHPLSDFLLAQRHSGTLVLGDAGSGQHLASVLQEGRKNATLMPVWDSSEESRQTRSFLRVLKTAIF